MLVCSHGDVSAFCEAHDMQIFDQYTGEIEQYRGVCPVLVTSQNMSEQEYYYLKGKLLGRGVELISTIHRDNNLMRDFLVYQAQRRTKNYKGKPMFGFRLVDGEPVLTDIGRAVTDRIFEMRDAGSTLREIREDERVCHSDGRKLSISTVQLIIKNRKKYKGENQK